MKRDRATDSQAAASGVPPSANLPAVAGEP